MVWGCFSWKGVGAFHQIKGILTNERYRQILIRQMRPSARQLRGDNSIFQHDNDPKHTANIVKNYLINQQIEMLEWRPQSLDLNRIENLWADLNRKLNKRYLPKRGRIVSVFETSMGEPQRRTFINS